MDKIRKQRAIIQASWNTLNPLQRSMVASLVLPMLYELDALIELLAQKELDAHIALQTQRIKDANTA